MENKKTILREKKTKHHPFPARKKQNKKTSRTNSCLGVFQQRHQRKQKTRLEPGNKREGGEKRDQLRLNMELYCYFIQQTPVTFPATETGNP